MSAGLFEVLAADESDRRLANRKALVLARTRIDERLGQFLKAASAEDFGPRYELVEEDFISIVLASCEEIGVNHEAAPTIQEALYQSYKQSAGKPPWLNDDDDDEEAEEDEDDSKESSVHEARMPKMCPYHHEVVDIGLSSGNPQAGYETMASHAWGDKHCQGDWDGGKCKFKREMVTQSYWDDRQKTLDERRDQRAEQGIPEDNIIEFPQDEVDPAPTDMVPAGHEDADVIDFPSESVGEESVEPVADAVPLVQEASTKQSDNNPSDQADGSGKEITCPECGGNGKTANNSECPKCHGKGKVNSWGPSTLDSIDGPQATSKVAWYPGGYGNSDEEMAFMDSEHPIDYAGGLEQLQQEHQQGMHQHPVRDCPLCAHPGEGWVDNGEERYHPAYGKVADANETGLSGPSPTMDKRRWSPSTVKEIDVPSKYNPTKRKDIIEPIKATNPDKLEEIGEKTTEHQTLPGAKPDESFATKDNTGTSGPTKTFPSGKAANPVTSRWGNIVPLDRRWSKIVTAEPSYPPQGQISTPPPAEPYNPGAYDSMVDSMHPAAKFTYERAVQQGANPQTAIQAAQAKDMEMANRGLEGQDTTGVQIPVIGKADDVDKNPVEEILNEEFVPEQVIARVSHLLQ